MANDFIIGQFEDVINDKLSGNGSLNRPALAVGLTLGFVIILLLGAAVAYFLWQNHRTPENGKTTFTMFFVC